MLASDCCTIESRSPKQLHKYLYHCSNQCCVSPEVVSVTTRYLWCEPDTRYYNYTPLPPRHAQQPVSTVDIQINSSRIPQLITFPASINRYSPDMDEQWVRLRSSNISKVPVTRETGQPQDQVFHRHHPPPLRCLVISCRASNEPSRSLKLYNQGSLSL